MSNELPLASADPDGERTHPLSAVVQGVLWGGAAFVGLVGVLLNRDSGLLGAAINVVGAALGAIVIGLIAGFASWYFTRFVIDGTELRITSGILTKKSRRIPYERIQAVDIAEPLLARLFKMAELRIDMAGGDSSRTNLRYLPLERTKQLRRLLLARAHGHTDDNDDPEEVDDASAVIAQVPPDRIMIGTVLSLDFLAAVVLLTMGVIGALVAGEFVIAIGGLLPAASWLFQIIVKRVIEQWNFTLTRGPRGLRIDHGLLNRSSQTIPYDRVQGIAVKEPFIWRRLGWQRLEVDVAGYSAGTEELEGTSISTLLPITDPKLAESVISELLPLRTESLTMDRPTSRSRIFAPIGWRRRWIEARQGVVVSQRGWIERSTSVVPHHKAQSVELHQGPLQRLRGVASVNVHTPPGPVDVDGSHLDSGTARRFWREQVERI